MEIDNFEMWDADIGWNTVDNTDSEILSEKALKKNKKNASIDGCISKLVKLNDVHYKMIRNINDIIKLPNNGEQYRLVTQQSFNIYTLILYILSIEETIDNLTLTTFNMNESTILGLFYLLESKQVKRLKIVISESINFRMPKRIAQLKEGLSKYDNFSLLLIWNHTKIALIETNNKFFVLEGSGNFSNNSEIEQYLFEQCKDSYDFHNNWINKIFNNKHLKRQEIYN